METKKEIRNRIRQKRNLIAPKELEEKSHTICQNVISHPFFLNAEEIYCYVDFRSEVKTNEILEAAWKCGKKVAVPKTEDGDMKFYYIHSKRDLSLGNLGIEEPQTEEFAHGDNVLVIMPGVAFDAHRHRIGYGGGYYDKYLMQHADCHTIALAFELQIISDIPAKSYDICPEVIITEEHIYV